MRTTAHITTVLSLVIALPWFSACSDYGTGYEHGYNKSEPQRWLLLGRQAYHAGFAEGQRQAFHDDWFAENAADIDAGLSCRAPVMALSPLAFNPELAAGNVAPPRRGLPAPGK